MLRFIFALFVGFSLGSAVEAAPRDGRVVEGAGSIERSGNHTDIRQQSDFLATSWDNFNIAAHESVQAHQPAASSRLLIRVDGGGGATNIAGNYTSNGITILENRNGVQFSRGAIVNVGGLLATSSRISGVSGANWQLNGTGGAVVNHGQIAAGAGGVVLAAVRVENHGKITAQGSDVSLGAGSAFTVDFAGSLVGFEVKKAADGASLSNTGKIEAQGGIVSLSAQEAQAVRTNVVSVGGVVKATRIERRGGVVYLSGGDEGIAEVSGDVSASRKVQTTGKYVVVKDGALLKAPEILVGGDFQGGGDVPTSRRTLVEAGALLNAGKDGRVIVWSDETTWFNGDISAPGGFAEVSGKETLASVHLAGIDVGELLLDPQSITIALNSINTFTGSVMANDPPAGAATFGVNDINVFTGDLTLAATGFIRVQAKIDKVMGGLTLETFILQIDADITVAGDLTLSVSSMTDGISLTTAPNNLVTLTGRAVTINGPVSGDNPNNDTGDRSFTITASGNITINGDINLGTRTLTLTAGNGAGAGNIMNGGTARTLRAATVSLTQDGAFADNLFAIDPDTPSLTLTTGGAQEVRNWMASGTHDLNLMVGGDLGISTGNVDGINNGTGNLTIAADGVVTVSAAINKPTGNLTLIAGGNLRVNANIDIDNGTNTLTLTAGMGGTGDLVACSTCTLTAGTLNLTQSSAFGGDAPFIFAASTLSLTTNAAQTVQGWMTDGDRALSLTSGGVLTIGSNLSTGTGALTLSGTSIALGADIVLTGAAISLTGAITVASSSNNNLTINASGVLTLNSAINLGSGILTITADERINVPNNGTAIAAMAINITFTDSVVQTPAAGFTLAGGMATFTNANFSPAPTYTYNRGCTVAVCILGAGSAFEAEPVLNAAASIMINTGTSALTFSGTGAITITSPTVSITAGAIDIGGRALMITANGGALTLNTPGITTTGDITLTAASIALSGAATLTGAAITITAPTIDIGADRALTITASGALTLDTVDMITGMGTAALSLTGDTLAGLSTALTLNVPTVSLELTGSDSSFGATAPFAANSGITTLTITTAADQDYRGWMAPPAGRNRNLTIDSQRGIRIGSTAINLGTGNLILNGELGVVLTNVAGLTITAGDFTLFTGAGFLSSPGIDVSHFVVMAGGDITTSSITLGTMARVELLADNGSIIANPDSFGGRPVIGAGVLLMRQMGIFADSFFNTTSSVVTGSVSFRVTGAGVDQTIHPWMAGLGRTDFSLRGVDGVTLDSITLPAAADFGTTAVDLQAATINLGGNAVLTGGAVSLTGEITAASSSNNNLTIRASGVLTLNDNINLGTGDLLINAMGGTTLGGAVMLTANGITISGGITSVSHALTITAATALSLNDDINTGTGDLTLDVGSIGGTFSGVRMLSGNVVTISGAAGIILSGGDLTISALGNLMVNAGDGITVGANTLRLEAGRGAGQTGNITFGDTALIFQAGNFVLVQDGAVFPAVRPADFRDETGTANSILLTGNPAAIRIIYDGAQIQDSVAWASNARAMISLGTGGTDDFEVSVAGLADGVLLASVSITLNAGTGVLTFAGADDITLTAPTITITAGSINTSGRNLTITTDGGTLTLNSSIDTGLGNLTLTGATIQIGLRGGAATHTLNGANITLTAANGIELGRLTRLGGFRINNDIANLTVTASGVLTIAADITADSTARSGGNIALTGSGSITFGAAARTITGRTITLSGGSITFGAEARTISGVDITLMGVAASDANLTINASSTLTLNSNIALTGAGLTLALRGAGAIVGVGTPELTANTVRLRQVAAFAEDALFTFGSATGSLLLITDTNQDVFDWMIALDRNLTVRSSRRVRVMGAAIGSGGNRDLGAGVLTLRSTGGNIRIVADIATTGNVTITTSGTLTINNPITLTGAGLTLALSSAGAISNGGGVGASRPLLTASTVSLTQGAAFATTGPFRFAAGSLEFTTDAVQDVHNWMIRDNINLTVTSALQVRVGDAIGAGNRNLGTGDLTLTSTGGAVRIFADISTMGSLTLNGNTGINFNNREAKTLRGAAITLTGTALSNRALILDASGTLTLSGDINTGTSALVLTGGTGGIALDGALTLTADSITISNAITGAANASLTITADTLTLNNDITLTGTTSILALRSRQGAITGGVMLSAPTVRLRQVAAFAEDALFTFGSATGSLLLITDTNQDVHDWMIALDRNLTVRSSRRVRVDAAIGSTVLNRNLGAGSLTLRSTGGVVRILADISTTGSLTLIGPGAISNGDRVGANRPALTASTVSFTQDAAFATTGLFRFGSATGSLEFTTTARQDVHNWMIRENTNLTVTSSDRVRVLAAIGAGARNLGTGSLTLTSTGGDVRIVADITTTGDVTLDASGILTISSDIDIGTNALTLTSGAGAISNGGSVGADRPLLTASTVSFRQDAAFAAIRPFRFGAATGSLEFTTEAAQDVHNWMIPENTNLTVTSAANVFVRSAIGDGLTGRDLGNGSITLTSTGGAVRILADISTTGDLTLDASTLINLNGGAAKTLAGAIITLTGNALSNRDLTITASGVLTINNNIDIGTGALSLTGNPIADTGVNLDAGSYSFGDGRTCTGSTMPSCTTTP